MSFDAEAWQRAAIGRVEPLLRGRFAGVWPPAFAGALEYPLFTGGKRVRPALALAACEAVAGSCEAAVPVAVAFELVHTYSLVHDDLPCMDDDDLRRGMPTVHKRFDEATAVLVGDGLLTEAFVVLAEAPLSAEVRIALVQRLATAAGVGGMVGGQAADIAGGAATRADLEAIHARKTGALIAGAVVCGGLVAGATSEQLAVLEAYGRDVGLGFQLADDVLDAAEVEDPHGPPSFVRFLGVEATRAEALALGARAEAAAAGLPHPGPLVALARASVDRAR